MRRRESMYVKQAVRVFEQNGNKPSSISGMISNWPTRRKPSTQQLSSLFGQYTHVFMKVGHVKDGNAHLWCLNDLFFSELSAP